MTALRDPFASWAELLPLSHRRALHAAVALVVDEFLVEYPKIAAGTLAVLDAGIGASLPPKHAPRYSPGFAKRYFVCVVDVAGKLAAPRGERRLLSCTADELALRLLVDTAVSVLDDQGVTADFGAFEDTVFEDVDFESLYDPAQDGFVDPSEPGVHLRFEEWFRPFSEAAVHPYVADD